MKILPWPDFKGYRNIELGLTRVYDLLDRLDNPQNNLPPTIHIAGTNGKGSTLSFLRQIFTEAGYSAHIYTSPHLVNFNERIVLSGAEISDDFLSQCLLECKKASEKSPKIEVTFFEGITAAAFLAFSKIKADVLLLETGMGGRLDATNILPKVLCSIITPIAFDHTDFLGKTLQKIAFEKAGIIKKNCPVIVGKQKKLALKTIVKQASLKNSEIKIFNQNWKIKKKKNEFLFSGLGKKFKLPLPSLQGDHQIENSSVAITTILSQKKFKITKNHIKSALTKTFWQARLQKITSGKFFQILPKNYELYLDGSHNLQGASTVKKFLESKKDKKIFVIFSMLQDKNCEGFLQKISPIINQLIALEIPNETKSYKKEEIVKIAKKIQIKSISADNFNEAFSKILSKNKKREDSIILVCGSLYLAGSFLELNQDL
jgi:dihydrofolate synthase/folylpolyglutamate synthase